jgi:hypothetical protein
LAYYKIVGMREFFNRILPFPVVGLKRKNLRCDSISQELVDFPEVAKLKSGMGQRKIRNTRRNHEEDIT